MSQDMNKTDQKERWKFVLEKFSHASMGIGKRNVTHHGAEPQLLEMPECKRGKFVAEPSNMKSSKGSSKSTVNESTEPNEGPTNDSGPDKSTIGKCVGNSSPLPFEEQTELEAEDTGISVSVYGLTHLISTSHLWVGFIITVKVLGLNNNFM